MELNKFVLTLVFTLAGCGGGSATPPGTLTEASPLLEHAWELVSFGDSTGTPQKVRVGTSYILQLDQVHAYGFINCNRFTANYQVDAANDDEMGGAISFSDLAAQEIACADTGMSTLEQQDAIINAITSAHHYKIDGDTLLIQASDTMVLKFRPQYELCADPLPTDLEIPYYGRFMLGLDPSLDRAETIKQLQDKWPDLTIHREIDGSDLIIANASDRTLKALRCTDEVSSIYQITTFTLY